VRSAAGCDGSRAIPFSTAVLVRFLAASIVEPFQWVAEIFGVGPRTLRRWRDGSRPIPHGVKIVLEFVVSRETSDSQS
jgi:hypothetical protein